MRNRRLWINIARVVFTLVLVFLITRLIHVHDEYWIVKTGRTIAARDVAPDGDGWRAGDIRYGKDELRFREGFLSLFRRLDFRMYLLIAPVFLLPIAFCALRWHLLLRAHGFDASFRSILTVTYVGGFFNNFLPGAVGGDIARAVIAARDEERKAALVGTILVDRIIGLAAMVGLASVCVAFVIGDPSMRFAVRLVVGLLAAMVVGYFVYFSRTLRNLRLARWVKGKGKFGEVVRDVDGAVQLLRHRKGLVAQCVLLSFGAQSVAIVGTFLLARLLGVTHVNLPQFFVFDPLIFVITAVPITAGRFGVQEGAFAFLFGRVGVAQNQAVALSLLYTMTSILVSLPGGILFGLGAARRRRESGTAPQVGGATRDVPAHE